MIQAIFDKLKVEIYDEDAVFTKTYVLYEDDAKKAMRLAITQALIEHGTSEKDAIKYAAKLK